MKYTLIFSYHYQTLKKWVSEFLFGVRVRHITK